MYLIFLLSHIVTTYSFIFWPATLFLLSVHTNNHHNFIPVEGIYGCLYFYGKQAQSLVRIFGLCQLLTEINVNLLFPVCSSADDSGKLHHHVSQIDWILMQIWNCLPVLVLKHTEKWPIFLWNSEVASPEEDPVKYTHGHTNPHLPQDWLQREDWSSLESSWGMDEEKTLLQFHFPAWKEEKIN